MIPDSGLHSGVIPITRNLEAALRHLRYETMPRYMWIDALCINQADDEEKSVQVANMGAVYAAADSTIAWLGPRGINSDEAMEILREIASYVEIDWTHKLMRPSESSFKASKSTGLSLNSEKSSESNDATQWGAVESSIPWFGHETDWVYSLLARPYFERAWIVQEILLSRKIQFQCGLSTISGDDFWKSVFCLRFKSRPSSMGTTSPAEWQRVRYKVYKIARWESRPQRFVYHDLRFDMQGFHCRDPRDKVYTALGLLTNDDKKLGIIPDYSLDTEKVYMGVAERVIKTHCTLCLLESCEFSNRSLEIPSWVPDWSTPLHVSRPVFTNWSACGFISAYASVDMSSLCCTVAGIAVTTIADVQEANIDNLRRGLVNLLRFLRIIRPTISESQSLYVTGEDMMEAYCRTLGMDRFSTSFQPHRLEQAELAEAMNTLALIWSMESGAEYGVASSLSMPYCNAVTTALTGRCFFTTSEGYIGLAPRGTKPKDVVCVLLGCSRPVVLRPSPTTEPTARDRWHVVGVSYVHGLMNGEVIYRHKHIPRYKSVWRYACDMAEDIDNYAVALHDSDTNTFRTDPAELLQEAGIKVERYKRNPHKLEVLPESLRAAGVALEEFVLV